MTHSFGCVGNTIRLRSGKYLDLANPTPKQFTFADIAGALSKICRFGGQCERFYSVAEHCVKCVSVAIEDGCSLEEQAAVLMHDATEAFLGDVVKPLKILLPEYQQLEQRMEAIIAHKFRIDFAAHAEVVRRIDREMLICERRQLAADNVTWAGENEVRAVNLRLSYLEPAAAEALFVEAATCIGIEVREFASQGGGA